MSNLIVFTVKGEKITHDLKKSLTAGSSGMVKAVFQFDASWDDLKKVIVFTNSHCPKPVPVKFTDDEIITVPDRVLQPGKLYVSCVGFGENGARKTTQAWDVQQAITVQKCGDLGSCELLRHMVDGGGGEVSEDDIAKDEDVVEMLENVFGGSASVPPTPSGPTVEEDDIATDQEVLDFLDQLFPPADPNSGS